MPPVADVNSSSIVLDVDEDVEVDVLAPGVDVDEDAPGVDVDVEDDEGVVIDVDVDSAEDDDEDAIDDDVADPATLSGARTRGSCLASPMAHAAPTTTSAAVIAVKIPSVFLISFFSFSGVVPRVGQTALRCPQEEVKKRSRAASEA